MIVDEAKVRDDARQRFEQAQAERLKAYAAWETRAVPVLDLLRESGNGFWYLMTPYTKYPAGVRIAYQDAVRVTASFTSVGLNVYCPIVHAHPQALVARLPGDVAFWWDRNLPFMQASAGAVVMEMEGWKESVGITAEIDWFEKQGKPVLYLPCPPMRNQ